MYNIIDLFISLFLVRLMYICMMYRHDTWYICNNIL